MKTDDEFISREKEKIDESKRIAQSIYESYKENFDCDDLAFIFLIGANWSDNHPVSTWMSVNESLPKKDPKRNDYMSVEVLTITDK